MGEVVPFLAERHASVKPVIHDVFQEGQLGTV